MSQSRTRMATKPWTSNADVVVMPGISVPSGSKARSSERGAALIEAAIITPLFVMLIFAIFELGLVFRNSLTVQNAVQEGVRAASIQGNRSDADFAILRSIEHGIQAAGTNEIEYVIVFKAAGPGEAIPNSCHNASRPKVCNRYSARHFTALLDDAAGNDTGNFRCGNLDSAWCPTDRVASLSAGVDYIGVHIVFNHYYLTGMFGNATKLTSTAILPVEPDSP